MRSDGYDHPRTWALTYGFLAWYLVCKFWKYNVLPFTVYDLYLCTTPSSGEFFISQVMAWYIQYQHIYSTDTYSKKVHSPTPVPEGHKGTHQFKLTPQVLAWYIQYQHIYSTDTYSKNVHSPTPVPEGHTETHWIKFIPQVSAWYIQYQHIYSTDTYSKMGHSPTPVPEGHTETLWDIEDRRHWGQRRWGQDIEDRRHWGQATLRTGDFEDKHFYIRHWGQTLRTNIFLN